MIDTNRARTRLAKAFEEEKWALVLHRAAPLLKEAPEDAALHFMTGVAQLRIRQLDQAIDALETACRLQPERTDYLARFATALAAMRRLARAREVADRAMSLSPDDAETVAMLGRVYLQANAIEAAAEALHKAVSLRPGNASYRFDHGYVLAALGDAGAAERELERCIDLEPRRWAAHLSLSKLRKQTGETQHMDRLRALLERHGADAGAQIFLNLALGKELEDLGEFEAAFRHYARGKAAARGTRPPSAERDRKMFEAITAAFPAGQAVPTDGDPDPAPIFVIGMPRSGTTLLDRILTSHPEVCGAGELQNFATVLQQASTSPIALLSTPDIAAHVRDIDWKRLGAAYIESTRPDTAGSPRFTDNLPHNFLYAGFIARALPNARILCLRRDPLDTCLGNFRQLFEMRSGYYDYSLDLLDTGRYFVQFEQLMDHWKSVLPGRILEVSYESLVQDPEPAIREVLAFCDLPWNDACLHSETNAAPVNTPHAWQVRAPIYTSAVGRWRHFAVQLQPLRDLLSGAGIALPD